MKGWAAAVLAAVLVLSVASSGSAQEAPPRTARLGTLELSYDPSLASYVLAQRVPEPDPSTPDGYYIPGHTEFAFWDRPFERDGFPPADVRVIPFQAYHAKSAFGADNLDLLSLLLDQRPPLRAVFSTGQSEIPRLPGCCVAIPQNTALAYVDGPEVQGIRYAAHFAQNTCVSGWPRDELVYTFLGITTDGRSLVTARFPVTAPIALGPFEPTTQESAGFQAECDAYEGALAEALEAVPPTDFVPALPLLDNVVRSLHTVIPPTPTIAPTITPRGASPTPTLPPLTSPTTAPTTTPAPFRPR